MELYCAVDLHGDNGFYGILDETGKRVFKQRKVKRSKQVVATKALAGKICKACYFIMRDRVDFDVKLLFG